MLPEGKDAAVNFPNSTIRWLVPSPIHGTTNQNCTANAPATPLSKLIEMANNARHARAVGVWIFGDELAVHPQLS